LRLFKRKNNKVRLNALYGVQFPTSPLEEVNFDFTPTLISQRAYNISDSILKLWRENDCVANYLLEILPRKALGLGFELVDKETGQKPAWWDNIKGMLDDLDFNEKFLDLYISARTFGKAVMNYTSDGLQIIEGDKIMKIEKDEYDNPITFTIQTVNGMQIVGADEIFYIVNKRPYLQPIFNNLVYIYWIEYSMCEAAAREGSKFTVVETEGLDESAMNVVRSRFVGLSARKLALYDKTNVKDIKVLDTKLNATFTEYLSANFKKISLYTGVPEAILTGVHAGALTGSEVNVGSLYEVYQTIQKDAEKWVKKILRRMIPTIDFSEVEFKWNRKYRLSEREEEEIKMLRAQRHNTELSYKTVNEIREEEGLEPLDESITVSAPKTISVIKEKGVDKGI